MDGPNFLESILLILHTFGGLPTWFKSPYLGATSPSLCCFFSLSHYNKYIYAHMHNGNIVYHISQVKILNFQGIA